jgi:ammonia channel protein AmtB
MAEKPGPPLWEIAVIVIALLLLFVVFVLWWFFGYSYSFAEQPNTVLNTLGSTTTTLLGI